MSAILQLNLHRKFFCQIATGPKRTEFRELKPYWKKGLENRKYNAIQFRHGYATNAPTMLVEFHGVRRRGKGANAEYAIRLGKILKMNGLAKKSVAPGNGIS